MDHLELGRTAYERRAWSDAYEALSCADRGTPLAVDDLDCLATAAYLTGREREFQQIIERLYRAHAASGARERAARCTFWLAITFLFQGERGRANAWTARGQQLAGSDESPERGYLAVLDATQALGERNPDAALAAASRAVRIGQAANDPDLVAAARHLEGRALIQRGEVAAGLTCLDDTMLAVVGGELRPIMTGLMYCSVIDTCRCVYALGRAREWTRAFSDVCQQQPDMLAFTGVCQVHRAEILQLQGAWEDALTEAGHACERAAGAGRRPPAAALYQQGEIHRLRGEFDDAEDAYRRASELGYEPQPGLALLRLAQGRTSAACTSIRRLVSTTKDPMRRARLLPAHLEIMLACGEAEEAQRARDELATLAKTFDADALRATVAQADGAMAIASGDPNRALDPLRRAFEIWTGFDAPYEAARVRVLIGEACRALGDSDAAALELAAATSAFERLSARPELERVGGAGTGGGGGPLTSRELHVLRLISTGRTNKQIAAELSLSERTVDRHVTNILTKLDVPSRTAATAYAYDHKLF